MRCSICKSDVTKWKGYHGWEEMKERRECFHCFFWMEKIRDRSPHAFVARWHDGIHHFSIGSEDPNIPSFCRGYGGTEFRVTFIEGDVVTTTNLWHQGEIPERFWHLFPITAKLEWVS